MNVLDIIIFIIVIGAGIYGWRRGALRQLGRLAGIVAGIIVCRVFGHKIVYAFISPADSESTKLLCTGLIYVLLFILVYLAVSFMARTLKSVTYKLCLAPVDRICGVIFSVLEWVFFFSLLLNLWFSFFPDSNIYDKDRPWRAKVVSFAPEVLASAADFDLNLDAD